VQTARVGSHLLRQLASAWLGSLDALAFPLSCQICEADGLASPFCDDCRRTLLASCGPSCTRCAMPVGPWFRSTTGCSECRKHSLGFDAAIALGPYQSSIRALCLRLKREHNAWLIPWMADLLIEGRGELLSASGADMIAAVPLHWARRLIRGYDQAHALAIQLARKLQLPFCRPLRRAIWTPPLAGLGRQARADTLQGVFRPRRGTDLHGRTVLLVDDILTTGTTCGVAARLLKQAGARRVIAVVLGRAEGRA
jgi:ComF family protein